MSENPDITTLQRLLDEEERTLSFFTSEGLPSAAISLQVNQLRALLQTTSSTPASTGTGSNATSDNTSTSPASLHVCGDIPTMNVDKDSSSSPLSLRVVVTAFPNKGPFTVRISELSDIKKLREIVQTVTSIPPSKQRLICIGHQLTDGRSIKSYNIKDGYTIHLVQGRREAPNAGTAVTLASMRRSVIRNVTFPRLIQTTIQLATPIFGGLRTSVPSATTSDTLRRRGSIESNTRIPNTIRPSHHRNAAIDNNNIRLSIEPTNIMWHRTGTGTLLNIDSPRIPRLFRRRRRISNIGSQIHSTNQLNFDTNLNSILRTIEHEAQELQITGANSLNRLRMVISNLPRTQIDVNPYLPNESKEVENYIERNHKDNATFDNINSRSVSSSIEQSLTNETRTYIPNNYRWRGLGLSLELRAAVDATFTLTPIMLQLSRTLRTPLMVQILNNSILNNEVKERKVSPNSDIVETFNAILVQMETHLIQIAHIYASLIQPLANNSILDDAAMHGQSPFGYRGAFGGNGSCVKYQRNQE